MELKKIFVSKQAGIGDALLVTSVLASLKREFPDSTITFMTTPSAAPAVQGLPFIDHVLIYDKKKDSIWKVIRSIWHYDAAFFFDLQYRAAVLAFFAGIPIRVGLKHKRKFWLTHGLPWEPYMDHTYEPYVFADILQQTVGIELPKDELDTLYFVQPTPDEEEAIAELLREQGIESGQPYIACSPVTSYLKDWPVDLWQQFIKEFYKKYKIPLVILGNDNGNEKLWDVEGAVSLCGRTNIKQVGYLIKNARLLVSSCSMPLHIAAAFDVPCVGLYGYSDPKRWAPRNNCVIVSSKRFCSPCDSYAGSHCQDAQCMKEIRVEEVLEACHVLIENMEIRKIRDTI